MGWLEDLKKKKEGQIPVLFKDKSEDDILKMLDDASKDKQKLQDLENRDKEREAEVTTIKTQFEDVKARLAAAEAKPPKKPAEGEGDGELADFVTEPDKAFGQRITPIADIAIRNAAITSRMLAQQMLDNQDMASGNKTMDGRLFRAWGTEIDAQAKKYQAIQLSSPDGWLGIFYYLKGTHADELRDPEIRKTKYNFLEPASSSTTQPGEKDKPADDQLTDKEKQVADRMGVTHENYLKRKKSMQFVNA